MRRLIVEFPLSHFELNDTAIHKLKSYEIYDILRLEPSEFSALVRVQFGSVPPRIEEVFPPSSDANIEHELLEVNDEIYTYFVRISARQGQNRIQGLGSILLGGYLSTPFEVKDGKAKVTFLATAKQVKSILRSLQKEKISFKIISIMDARFSPNSPVSRLTRKQREVLTKALELGYYDRPRRISSEELAKKLGLTKSTLVVHRRKAEKRVLSELLNK